MKNPSFLNPVLLKKQPSYISDNNLFFKKIEHTILKQYQNSQKINLHPNPIAILDLDGTIFNNFPRQIQVYKKIILPKFSQLTSFNLISKWNQQIPVPYSILPSIRTVTKSSEVFHAIQRIFLKYFLTDQFLKYDQPYILGNTILKLLTQLNYDIIFLTGRLYRSMYRGTKLQLENLLPNHTRAFNLIMKPSMDISDDLFKYQIIKRMEYSGFLENHFIFFLDDNPQICRDIKQSYSSIKTMNCVPYANEALPKRGIDTINWY